VLAAKISQSALQVKDITNAAYVYQTPGMIALENIGQDYRIFHDLQDTYLVHPANPVNPVN